MRTLMLAVLVVAFGLTSGCFISKKEVKEKETYSNRPMTQADCERAGGKWKSSPNRCDLD
jgi:uncharacterized protein YneF (UPF0154 family)